MKNKIFSQIASLLIIIGISGSAGAVGAALAISAVNMTELLISGAPAATPPPRVGMNANLDAVSAAARGSAVFYRAHAGSGVDGVFLPKEAVGEAVIVTADGWLMSTSAVLSSPVPLVAVFANGQSVPVPQGKAIKDDATGLAFVRVEIDRLEVATFGNDADLLAGETVFSPGAASIGAFPVQAVRQIPAATRAELVESSEKFSRRLILGTDRLVSGAPVIDPAGKIVAVAVDENIAVPAPYFTEILKGVFVDKKVTRPVLGVHFLSVANVTAPPAANLPSEGALVTGGGKVRAVAAASPAEAAGLKEGDVILAVERDRITKEAPLNEIISEYSPGAKLELTVSRGGKEIKVPVTLK